MKVCIRRGAKQIGGTCIEIESQGKRLVLDIGLPLDSQDPLSVAMPRVTGLQTPDESLVGVVLSHPHLDHYGLAFRVSKAIPFLMGEAAERILAAAAVFTLSGAKFDHVVHLVDRRPITLGPFTMTPFLVDHSAYDAYAVLVEADGKRLFYTGDLRAHGRKGKLFERLVAHPPTGVDVLLVEGTTIGRQDASEHYQTEDELEDDLVPIFRAASGMPLVWCSGQNIDRIVTVYKAAKKARRQLIVDMYTAHILKATGNPRLPQASWSDMRVFLPKFQKARIKRQHDFALAKEYRPFRIFPEELTEMAGRSVMLFRPTMCQDVEQADCLAGAELVYSMWDGYLKDEKTKPFLAWLKERGIPMHKCHTSGHAPLFDLQRLRKAFGTAVAVPVHCAEPDVFAKRFDGVTVHGDNEWWDVDHEINEEGSRTMAREYKTVEWSNGMHLVRKNQVQLKFVGRHATDLLANFDAAVKATQSAAPVRSAAKPYKLHRPEEPRKLRSRKLGGMPESFWERGVWESRKVFKGNPHGVPFDDIQSYQVMLRATNKDKEWGEIDLVGVSRNGLPVIIELKSEPSQCLLFAMIEVMSYGIAVRKAWENGTLRAQWKTARGNVVVPENLGQLDLVCAAPADYWQQIGLLPGDSSRKWKNNYGSDVITKLQELRKQAIELKDGGYRITFVSLNSASGDDGYPQILGAEAVVLGSRT